MSVNDPCVSIATGTLGPDLRVNYAYGMVLGLGEFLQEQHYFLQKDYRDDRALHGFGTVYGLQVSTEPTTDVATDWTVTVSPGMAIDQWGREVVVRTAQCARLGAWLRTQEQSAPGTIAANLGLSGDLTIYVTAKYAECLDDLVPLPGQPCSSSEQTKVASRIRDAWDIELAWSPPPMPEWDTDRRLARLLNSVQIVAGLDPTLSSEPEIIAAVRALPDDVDAGADDLWPLDWPALSTAPSGPALWRLPAETANDALDRIFTVWVTQVRPMLSPSLTAPPESWDPSILLASITLTLGPVLSSVTSDPVIASCDEPDDAGRPYVLHTRLIQELRILSAGGGGSITKAQELATVSSTIDANGGLVLTAWFHLDHPVSLTEPVQVTSNSGATLGFAPTAVQGIVSPDPNFSDVWQLTPAGGFAFSDGDQVAVSFAPRALLIGDAGTSLADRMSSGLDLLDTMPAGDVVVYATVHVPAPVQVSLPVAARPVLEFVTVTSSTPVDVSDDFFMEFWFHPQLHTETGPRAVVSGLGPEQISYVEESDIGNRSPATNVFPAFANVYSANFHSTFGQRAGYVRFLFAIEKLTVTLTDPRDAQGAGETLPLLEWMDKEEITFLNWDAQLKTISAYCHIGGGDK